MSQNASKVSLPDLESLHCLLREKALTPLNNIDAESSKADRGATSENDSEESQVLEVQKVEKGSKNKRKAPRKGKTAKKAKARVRMSSNAPDSDPEGSTEESKQNIDTELCKVIT